MDVERLGLADVGTTVGGHIEDGPLGDLPNRLEHILDGLGDLANVLDGSTVGDDLVTDRLSPETTGGELAEEVLVDNGELTGEDTTIVHVGGEGLGGLVVAQDLSSGGSRHGSHEERVAHAVLSNLLLEAGPVPAVAGGDAPHVVLELALAGGRSLVGLVGALLLGKLATGGDSTEVDGLEDVLVELTGLGTVERHLELLEAVSKTLDADTDGTVTHVGVLGLLDGVEVAVNDTVQVAGDNLTDLTELVKVKDTIEGIVLGGLLGNELGQTDRGKVANGNLIGGGVLNNLGTEVGALDGTEVLLVGLVVAVVLEEHVGGTGLDLRIEDGEPELLSLDGLAALALLLVLLVEGLELLTVAVGEAGALIGAHEGPLAVGLDTLHEEVGNPKGVEQITGTVGLVAVVLTKVEEGEDIGMPGLDVGGDTALALSSALIDVPGSVVEDTEHRNDAVGGAVGTTDVGLGGTDVGDGHADAASVLGDDGELLEGVVDAVDGVLLHGEEEARGHLGVGSSGVEESGGGMGEESVRQKVVGLEDAGDVVHVDADGDAHEHVLGTLGDLAVDLEQVGLLQSLEAEVVELKVTVVHNGGVEGVLVLHDDVVDVLGNEGGGLTGLGVDVVAESLDVLREALGRHLVHIGNADAGGQDGAVGMVGGEGGGSLGGQLVELDGGNAGVDALDDLLRDLDGVDMLLS